MLQFGLTKVTNHELAGSHVPYWAVVIGSLLTIILCGYSTLPTASRCASTVRTNHCRRVQPPVLRVLHRLPLPRFKRMMHDMLSSPPTHCDAILDELYGHGRVHPAEEVPAVAAGPHRLPLWVVSAVLYVTLGGVD